MKKSILKLFLMLFTLTGMAQTYKITSPKVEVKTDSFKVFGNIVSTKDIIQRTNPARLTAPLQQVFLNSDTLYQFRVSGSRFGNPNIFSGLFSGPNITTGTANNNVGSFSQIALTTGNKNNSFGNNTLAFNQNSDSNNAFGFANFYNLIRGSNNSAFGDVVAPNLRYGFGVQGFGANSLTLLDSAININVFGNNSLQAALSPTNTNVFGSYALNQILYGTSNNIFGNAGYNYTNNESFNTIVGNSNGITGENNNVILADGAGNEVLHIDASDRNGKRILMTDNTGVGKYNYITSSALTFNPTITAGQVLTAKADGFPSWETLPTPNLTGCIQKSTPEYFNTMFYRKNSLTDYSPIITHDFFGWNQFDLRANNGNIYVGRESGKLTTSGTRNNNIGGNSLTSITTGNDNNVVGSYVLENLTTGSNNTAIGPLSTGSAYTSIESNNTLLGKVQGTAGDNNKVIIADGAGNQILNVDATIRTPGLVLTTDDDGVGRFVAPAPSLIFTNSPFYLAGSMGYVNNQSFNIPANYTGNIVFMDNGTVNSPEIRLNTESPRFGIINLTNNALRINHPIIVNGSENSFTMVPAKTAILLSNYGNNSSNPIQKLIKIN